MTKSRSETRLSAERRAYLARRLYALGPRPLDFFLFEILERGTDPLATLEAYAALDAGVVAALGGRDFPALAVIEGGAS